MIGQAMAEHPGIDKITFTGETEDGQEDPFAPRREPSSGCRWSSAERSPNAIVFADADLRRGGHAAPLNGIFYGKGEVCAAGSETPRRGGAR